MRAFFRMIFWTFQGISRNIWLSFVTTSIFFLTLLTVNTVIALNVLARASLASLEEKVQVELYFLPGTSEDMIKNVRGYLSGLTQVRDVVTVSAEEALVAFRERHAYDKEIIAALEEVEENPFGYALRVQAQHPEDFSFILDAIDNPEFAPYIKEKDYADYETIIERLTTLTQRIYAGGVGLALFFGLISLLIVFNTIRVGVYTHRDEIAVMKLVGARDWFIRGPYLCEIVVYAGVATGAVAGAIFLALTALDPVITQFFSGIPLNLFEFYTQNGLVLFTAQWLGLSILGVLTTLFALGKFLKT